MIVDFTSVARDDLTAIGEWIAHDDPERATSFVDELIDRAETLGESLGLYPEIDAVRHPGVRRMNYRGYRIFYRVSGDAVQVLHIHHGSRGVPDFPA